MIDTETAERAFRIGVSKLGISTPTFNASPPDFAEARRAFNYATDSDPTMGDAWLGLAQVQMAEHAGTSRAFDRDLILKCYETRARIGLNQDRLGIPRGTLKGLYPAGPINLLMRSAEECILGRAALHALDGQYDDAVNMINSVKDATPKSTHDVPDYLLGTIYAKAERWPDVLTVINAHEFAPETMLGDCTNFLAGQACARLGLFNEANRRLEAVTSNIADVYNRAILERAYVFRALGEESQARTYFEALRAHRGDPELTAAASRALTDPDDRLTIVTEDQIHARTDIWNPATTPEAAGKSLSAERRAELLKEAQEELAELIGLESVKDRMEDLQANAIIAGKLAEKGLPVGELTENILLSGPSGVGKTIIARIVAKFFAAYGVVPTEKFVEVTEEDLVSKFVGETREKTGKVIDRALGGVLFIDEVYTLVKESREHNHGKEAIEALLHRLENDRASFVCIVAGYEEDIQRFRRTNVGIPRRFTQTIRFPSYRPDELVKIAVSIGAKNSAPLTDDARTALSGAFGLICAEIDPDKGGPRIDSLGNAGFVRHVIKHSSTARNRRLVREGADLDTIDERIELLAPDVVRGMQMAIQTADEEAEEAHRREYAPTRNPEGDHRTDGPESNTSNDFRHE